jgi:hypothetical protein
MQTYVNIKLKLLFVLGSYSGENEEYYLLGCEAV